ncbi:carph-isopro domain-containing protein [Nitrospirillum sp. BR 11163]|uniref:carph-isopro domain-containing protein n=1 Tax=Nitrospirillum sp. BR 11163 TaxID=3104323 RepID=UPI002AFE94C6|nr:hypothetical protein [Nitrospirillum sp. BR 11163]MEA1675390.1 hypothetical protein [Nitrospirillum sp. BR 11163]
MSGEGSDATSSTPDMGTPDMGTPDMGTPDMGTPGMGQGGLAQSGANPQVDAIVERFGGIRPMAAKLGIPVTTVQGWKKRGHIPPNRRADLEAAAARLGIPLVASDLDAVMGTPETPAAPTSAVIALPGPDGHPASLAAALAGEPSLDREPPAPASSYRLSARPDDAVPPPPALPPEPPKVETERPRMELPKTDLPKAEPFRMDAPKPETQRRDPPRPPAPPRRKGGGRFQPWPCWCPWRRWAPAAGRFTAPASWTLG